MNRILRIVYIALFCGLLLGLGLVSLRSFIGFKAPDDATVLNGRWTKAVETHYDDEFPIKRLGTNLWAALDFTLFHEGHPGVVLGRDQWLYSEEEFKPWPNAKQNVADNYALVEGVRQLLKAKGVKLVVGVVPTKVRLYPEHKGDARPAAIYADLYHDFHAHLAATKVLAPDLLAALQHAKQGGTQVFLRTDSHWTPDGAQVAAKQLAAEVGTQFPLSGEPQHFVTAPEKVEQHNGDLERFLPLDPLFNRLMPPAEPLEKRSTHLADGSADSEVPVTLVGTSYSSNPNWNFAGALKQALRSEVINDSVDGHGPILPMLAYLNSEAFKQSPPQVLIWEFPERYLPVNNEIGDADPQWVATLKQAGARQPQLVRNAGDSETPDRAKN